MIITENRSALHDYEILETWEAGIALLGAEVKSARLKNMRLSGAYVKVLDSSAFLVGAHISNYTKSAVKFDPERSRRLLLTRAEINKLADLTSRKGYAVVPLKLYTAGSRLKLQIALGRGRTQYGKRQVERERDLTRETERELKEVGV